MSLQESIVFTVASAVGGKRPIVSDAVVLQILFGADRVIDSSVELVELAKALGRCGRSRSDSGR
jgi:hypothetical protein